MRTFLFLDRFDRQFLKGPITIMAVGLGFLLPLCLLYLVGGIATSVFPHPTGDVIFTGCIGIAVFMVPFAYLGGAILALGWVAFVLMFVWLLATKAWDRISRAWRYRSYRRG